MNKLTPINQVSDDTINVSITAPGYLDRDRIGVDVESLKNILTILGIVRLTITSEFQAELHAPEIVGSNSDGTAIASKTAKKSQLLETDLSIDNKHNVSKRAHDLNVRLDFSAITQSAAEKSSARDIQALCNELNEEMKNALREAVLDLAKNSVSPGVFVIHSVLFTGGMVGMFSHLPPLQRFILSYLFAMGLNIGAVVEPMRRGEDVHMSLENFGGFEWGNYLRALVKIQTSEIIGVIKEEHEG